MTRFSLPLACAALAASALLSFTASAQKLVAAQLDKATIQVGETVQLSIEMELNDNPFCGMRVLWGDGKDTEIKVESGAKSPIKTSHIYASAGDFAIKAEPRRVTSHLPCIGKVQNAMVKVVAPAPAPVAKPATPAPAPVAAAASAPAKAAVANACPEGWKLDAKSANKKSGAFTCTAKAGTAAPEKKLACPGDTGYFENAKKGQLGCKL